MSRTLRPLLILALCVGGTLGAADQSPAEAKLRESLKNTMLQLRNAETDRATMQAAQTENDRKIKELTVQVATMTKHMAEDKDVADKSIADLKAKVEERDSEIAKFRESLEKWKSGFKQATELAASKESQRAKLAQQVIELNRRVADQKAKNEAMFKIGTEMLDRYASFGLGDALTAREPFIGLTRIKFQNLIQDYGDKIADQRIKP